MKASIARLHSLMREASDFLRFARNMDHLRTSKTMPVVDSTREVASYLASPTWRRHIYAFSIIGIYRAHERFIKDFTEDVADVLAGIYDSYSAFPQKVRAVHERLSLERGIDILDGRVGKHADFRQSVGNLHACLEGGTSINRDVFASSSSNFRSQVVRGIVARFGIELPSPEDDPTLSALIATELNGLYSNISSVVDDLAERRNQIAHGSDFEILETGLLNSILLSIYSYDCWLYRQVASALLRSAVIARGTKIGVVAKTYTASETNVRSIASVPDVAATLRPNDTVYLLHGEIRRAVIKSIQKSKTDVGIAEPSRGPYGIDLGVPVRDKDLVLRVSGKYAALVTMLHLALDQHPEQLSPGPTAAGTELANQPLNPTGAVVPAG